MANFELKDNALLLFKNENKKNANSPQMIGDLKINGKLLRVSLWKKEGKKGTFFSGLVSEPDPKYAKKSPATRKDDDDVFGD